ncbi:hypothetical protein GOB81_12235 [Acetobacter sp. LMG 1627]|uniref:Uncharacterized protein n=1 Tax=Acetobacter conturbans TaxID=1737472 RepID=A0ABX0K5F5_9PROT|nr:hypothetical protein [Acetobacter conturbans]
MLYGLDRSALFRTLQIQSEQIAVLTAQREAAQAEARATQIQANAVWRDIDDRTRICLQNGLTGAGRDFEILTIAGDAEAGYFGDQMQATLEAINKQVRRSQVFSAGGVAEYYIYSRDRLVGLAVARALSDCGLSSRVSPTRIDGAGIRGPAPSGFDDAGAIQLFINMKKKPHYNRP